MSEALRLREKRAEVVKEMQAISRKIQDESRSLTAEEKTKIEELTALSKDYRERYEFIDEANRQANESEEIREAAARHEHEARREHGEDAITYQDADLALRGQLISMVAPQKLTEEHRQAAKKIEYDLDHGGEMSIQLRNRMMTRQQAVEMQNGLQARATAFQSKGTNAKGGFLTNAILADRIETQLASYRGVREACNAAGSVIRTMDGNTLNYPTCDDTGNSASVLAENTEASVSDLTFAQKSLLVFKYSAGVIRSSIELLQDNSYDLPGYIANTMGVRIGRGTNSDFTNGTTATTAPRGIVTVAPSGVSATTAGDVTYALLSQLKRAVDPEYRMMPGAGYMMHDGIVGIVERLVDTQGNPIFRPSNGIGSPDMILNHPVYVNQAMVSSTTGSADKGILFGWFGAYVIRDVMEMSIQRLDERYATFAQVAWVGFSRHGGREIFASTSNAPIQALTFTT